jgi:foldase protein PrsA
MARFSTGVWTKAAVVAALALTAVSLVGCAPARDAAAPSDESELQAMVEQTMLANGVDRTTVAAVVNGTIVTQSQADEALAGYRASHDLVDDEDWSAYLASCGLTAWDVRLELICSLVDDVLVGQRAAELGLQVDDAEVDGCVASVEDLYPSRAAFLRALGANGYTEDSYRQAVYNRLVRAALRAAEVPDPVPTDEQIAQYAVVVAPTLSGRRSSHILFSADDYDLAVWVLAQLEDGADFAEMAALYSIDPSGADGGDMGWDSLNTYASAYQEALDDLEPGELAGPVRSRFGYHIILCTDRYDAATDADGNIDLDAIPADLMDAIEESMAESLGNQLFATYLGNLEASALVAVFDESGEQVAPDATGLACELSPLSADEASVDAAAEAVVEGSADVSVDLAQTAALAAEPAEEG